MSTLKLGMLGCGEVAVAKHLPALGELRDIEVVAAADVAPDRLRLVAQRFGITHGYPDSERLLAHPGLDAVAICLPPQFQAAAALAALKANKHVWIEPPIGLSLSECDAVIALAAASPGRVITGFHMRWHRLVLAARAIIRSGRLGPLQSLRAVWNSPRNEATLPEWRRHRSLGGGALIEVAMDHFDLWRYLLESEIEEVFALSLAQRWEDESAVLSGRMSNGVLLSAVFSERASHDVELDICGKAGRLRVACTRFDGLAFYPTYTMPGAPAERFARLAAFLRGLPRALPRIHRAGDYRISYREQWRHFLDCIRHDVPAAATLEDGRRALVVVLAAVESAETGKPVAVAAARPTLTRA